MRSTSLIRRGATSALRVFVLLGGLCLGAALHEWHHAVEPHCDAAASSPRAEHPCACTPMHAGALVAGTVEAPAPEPAVRDLAAPAPDARPTAAPRVHAAPRAPPAA